MEDKANIRFRRVEAFITVLLLAVLVILPLLIWRQLL